MHNFWENLHKFPRFLITVLIGFFLTTFEPIFKLLTNKKKKIIFFNLIITGITILYLIIKRMTESN
uniref:Uncharacterized protein ycf33 n=1 Tax=Acrosorium ciliolatum TaxID=1550622 RepID=A0A1Z1M2Q8_9FLOR|nr:hypothetical protein [Acrosorium ciliolatum]ARW60074.1 hypothetical protein [Acrosorium ciliolatum]